MTIEQLVTPEENGESGFPVEEWSTLGTAWMERIDVQVLIASRNERFAANQLSAPFETRWIMAYQPNMDPETLDIPKVRRLVYQDRTHDIVTAIPLGWHDRIELMTLARMG